MASRCRAMGKCTSQQGTLQNTSAVLTRLQVETLHARYLVPSKMGFLQLLHTFHVSDMGPWYPISMALPIERIDKDRVLETLKQSVARDLDAVTRSQMAVFLVRGVNGSDFSPPLPTGNVFEDVPPESFAAGFIEVFADLGITAGCRAMPPLFCPNGLGVVEVASSTTSYPDGTGSTTATAPRGP